MKNRRQAAYRFLVLLGVVSLFSDLTYEGARSILGPYLLLLGASASTVGFVSGLGEFIGYALRLVTGYISDKTKRYWLITIIGYSINLIVIPALALAPGFGWIYACVLIVLERFGKAIRNPAKTTIVSFAATEVGAGKGFALQEVLDQIGAFAGPLMLFLVLTLKGNDNKISAYQLSFALLAIPAAVALILLLLARKNYPEPQEFEKPNEQTLPQNGLNSAYWYYLVGIGFLALGFADFPLMAFHMTKTELLPDNMVPVLYSVAMGIDALSALYFGRMYDRRGITAIIISSALALFFCPIYISCGDPRWRHCRHNAMGYWHGRSGIYTKISRNNDCTQGTSRHGLWHFQCRVRGFLVCGKLDHGLTIRKILARSCPFFYDWPADRASLLLQNKKPS